MKYKAYIFTIICSFFIFSLAQDEIEFGDDPQTLDLDLENVKEYTYIAKFNRN